MRGDAEDLAEDVDQTLLAIEAEQHAGRAADAGLVHEQLNVGRHRRRVGKIGVGRRIQPLPVAIERPPHLLRPRAPQVEEMVDRDPVEPGAEAAAALERPQLGDHLDEDLLARVFGVLRQVHHAQRDVVDPRLVPPQQCVERPAVALLDQTHEFRVVGVRPRVGDRIHRHVSLDTPAGRV